VAAEWRGIVAQQQGQEGGLPLLYEVNQPGCVPSACLPRVLHTQCNGRERNFLYTLCQYFTRPAPTASALRTCTVAASSSTASHAVLAPPRDANTYRLISWPQGSYYDVAAEEQVCSRAYSINGKPSELPKVFERTNESVSCPQQRRGRGADQSPVLHLCRRQNRP
jgi:hypothetical protein